MNRLRALDWPSASLLEFIILTASYNAPMTSLKKLGHDDITTHGFRASFKTWALEATNFSWQVIEYALAHETRNPVVRAYIRGNKMLEKRREVMTAWEAYCDGRG